MLGRARRAPADRRHVERAHVRLADVQVEVDALEQGPHVQAEAAARVVLNLVRAGAHRYELGLHITIRSRREMTQGRRDRFAFPRVAKALARTVSKC